MLLSRPPYVPAELPWFASNAHPSLSGLARYGLTRHSVRMVMVRTISDVVRSERC